MDIAEITAKARVLLEAMPYIQDFHGSIFVVKYGGSFMDDPDPAVRTRVAYDIAFFAAVGIAVVVVHGGGKAITKAMDAAGLNANFVNGLRITDEATMAVVKRTLNEVVNKDVCDALASANARPKSLPGDTVLVCQKLTADDDGNPVDLGYVGEVTEVKIKLIKKEIADGFVPVISPVAEAFDGKPYNVNADLVAGRVASALRARRLVYMSDVPGLLANPADPASLISTLKISQVDELKKQGVIDQGMRPKVASAIRALQEGVQRVHFIDGRLPHSLLLEIFTDQGIGTEIVSS
ncbi:MAG TPA: acetylglutamate kinase [Opitutaceae bacterium]|jgi:acetylglutamate kinase|nr:acetylglutamate kinase [Opitutaceae bacterium]